MVMLDHVEDQMVSRVGRHGKGQTGRWVDAASLVTASFPQHTSRERDPQLHTHNAVLNRVLCPDGQWRAVDGKVLYAAKQGAAAIAAVELREALTRGLGVEWLMREDGNDFEVAGIDRDELDLLSARTRTTTAAADRMIAAFEEAHGRAVTAYERNRIMQQAALATRPAKSHDGESMADMLDRADAVMRGEVAGGLAAVAARFDTAPTDADTGHAITSPTPQPWSPQAVIDQAVEACHGDGGRSTFSRSELSRRIFLALPPHLGLSEHGQGRELIEGLTDLALASDAVVQTAGLEVGIVPAADRLANGRAATIGPEAVRYAARGHIAAEHALLRAAGQRGQAYVTTEAVTAWLDVVTATGRPGPSPAQREAVTALASTDAVISVLVGPAGTGKSYTIGTLADAWAALTSGRVIGVATAQVAADVLRDDGLTDAANTAAFLAAQTRLTQGRPLPTDTRWLLTAGDILAVDEASMLDTTTLGRLHAAVTDAGARMVLMGDPRQLGAVGAGGMMRTIIDGGAQVHTLSEVRRFNAEWERAASLQIRDGLTDAVTEYDRRGRLLDGGTQAEAVAAVARAAAADRLAGKDVVVVTGANAVAGEISAAVRRHLVEAGTVEETGVLLGRDGCTAGVGDLVQARRIDHTLGLTNRETYRVTGIRADGGLDLTSTRTGTPVVMPADYLAADATLAYAGTAHASEGATVDAGHLLITPGMTLPSVYVGMTRGRQANTVWAVTDTGIPHAPTYTARGVLAGILTGPDDHGDLSAHDIHDADQQLRSSAATLLSLIEDHTHLAGRARLDADLDNLLADGILTENQRARFVADQGMDHLTRQLRALEQAGHKPLTLLRHALAVRSMDGAHFYAQVLADRIDRAHGLPAPDLNTIDQAPDRITPDTSGYLTQIRALLDDRRHELGQNLAADPPAWALNAIGPVPDETAQAARADWVQRAGTVAAHREATGWTHPEHALGRCPGIHTPEKRADWHTAYTAAGMPETRRPEAELTDGRLRVRAAAADHIHAHAPAFVDPAMRARHQAADTAERDATHAEAQGQTEDAARLRATAARHRDAADDLTQIAEERAAYLLHHAETLTTGASAHEELIRRGLTPGTETDRTTANEWLTAETHARTADDAHRTITETNLAVKEDGEVVSEAGLASWPSDLMIAIPPLALTDGQLAEVATEAEIQAALTHAAAERARRAEAQSQDLTEPADKAWSEARDDSFWQKARDATLVDDGARDGTIAEIEHAVDREAAITEAGRAIESGTTRVDSAGL